MVPSRIAALLAFAIPVPLVAGAATEEPTVTVDESPDQGQPAPEQAPASPAPPPAAPLPVPVAPPPPTARAVESPGRVGAVAPVPPRPGTSVGIELGYAKGGDRFVALPSPSGGIDASFDAGDGMFVSLAGSWTPFWQREDRYGLGVYASAGIKYDRISNSYASASFTRYPIAAAGQLLVPVSERWFVLGRGGLLAEVGAKLSGAGGGRSFDSTDFAAKVGGFVDGGLYRAMSARTGIAVLLRYTYLDTSYAGSTTSANNFSAALGLYLTR